jgi:hypothetical protein
MKKPKAASTRDAESSERAPGPALPAWKAFVVQFSRETDRGAEIFAGRVEHLSSGRRAHFESAEELVRSLSRMLDTLEQCD